MAGLDPEQGVVASAMKQSVMEGIDEGVLIGETWLEMTTACLGLGHGKRGRFGRRAPAAKFFDLPSLSLMKTALGSELKQKEVPSNEKNGAFE